jgi:hypothetical protein
MSHHGDNPEQERILREAMKRLTGEFPNGRLNADDQGAVAVAIGHQGGAVTMQFPKNLNWIGFTPEQAIDIAQSLIEHARKSGCTKPLTVKIG